MYELRQVSSNDNADSCIIIIFFPLIEYLT